jgi:hypothetical protein
MTREERLVLIRERAERRAAGAPSRARERVEAEWRFLGHVDVDGALDELSGATVRGRL